MSEAPFPLTNTRFVGDGEETKLSSPTRAPAPLSPGTGDSQVSASLPELLCCASRDSSARHADFLRGLGRLGDRAAWPGSCVHL